MLAYLDKRQITPEYLLIQLEQKKQDNLQLEARNTQLEQEIKKKNQDNNRLTKEIEQTKSRLNKQIINLNLAVKKLQNSKEVIQNEKAELQFNLNHFKHRCEQLQQEHKKVMQITKQQYQLIKSGYLERIQSLQNNISNLNKVYNIPEALKNDRQQIIKELNNQKLDSSHTLNNTTRATILQNQQLTNELEYQSQQTVNLLARKQKLSEQVAYYKRELQIHKQIESDLVKRSSLAQNVIKQMTVKQKELELEIKNLKDQIQYNQEKSISSQSQKNMEKSEIDDTRELRTEIKKLNLQNATLKNEINYLENRALLHQTKYQSLAVIMSQYLQNVFLRNKHSNVYNQMVSKELNVTIDLNQLREKQIIQWKPQETQAIVQLLLSQLKPLISKKSLTAFPDTKNVNISLVEEQSKQPISLPKISSQYEQSIENEKKKNRFKDVPLDISTKIVRSNLRNWGHRIEMSHNKNKKSTSSYQSKSFVV